MEFYLILLNVKVVGVRLTDRDWEGKDKHGIYLERVMYTITGDESKKEKKVESKLVVLADYK